MACTWPLSMQLWGLLDHIERCFISKKVYTHLNFTHTFTYIQEKYVCIEKRPEDHYNGFLDLLKQVTSNLVVYNIGNVFFHSFGG